MYKVMIVDDEPLILKGLRAIIDWQQLGLQITSQAASGEQAMEAFLEEETDIIITDIRMPGMSGLKLIETVRSIDPGVKFIVLSGYDDFQYVKEGMKFGIENYLLKPIDVEELEATLRAVIVKLANVLQQQLAARKEQQILRDNILIRWVTQTISPLELKQRSELIGVPLGGGSFAVAVCGVMQPERQGDGISDEVRMEYVSEAHGTLQSLLGGMSPSALSTLCFVDLDGDIVLVWLGKGAELDRSVLQAELGEVMSQLRESLGVDVFLSIGITVQSFTKVHESYEQAKNLQTHRLINSRQSILDGEQARGFNPYGVMLRNAEELTERLAGRDTEGVAEWIEAAFKNLKQTELASPADAQNIAAHMLIQIGKWSKRTYLVDHFNALFQMRSMDSIQRYVIQFAREALLSLETAERSQSSLISKIVQDIHHHFAGELSLKTLSHTYGVHPVYLGQLFKKEKGVGFTEYVNNYRINVAKELLVVTDLKANEISVKVGYSDPNYFYKQFTKFTGSTPSDYRNSAARP